MAVQAQQVHVGEVIDRIGMGRFQHRLLWACGASWATDAMEVLLIGFAIPSLVADWNLSTAQAGLLASALFVGMLAGAWFWGSYSDYRGRRFSFLATIGIDSVFGLLSAFSPNFAVLLVLRLLTGFGVGGSLPVDYAIFSEFLPTRQRGRYLVYLESFWALGTIVAATLAWLIIPQFPEMGWRFLLAASAVPGLLVFWLRRTIPESPRFLMLEGREEEARAVLQRIARENGATVEIGPLAAGQRQAKAPLATIFDRTYRRRTLMLTAVWFLLSLGYYGLFTWLPGIFRAQGFTFLATFQNTLLLALAQVPGYFSAAWLVERWGRVRTLGVYLAGSALATFFFATLRDQGSIVLASVVMSFFALGAWGVLYAYTPELYPTSARGTGMGWASGVARMAGVIAPLIGAWLLTVDLAIALGFYALAFGAAALITFTAGAETMGRPLEEVERTAPARVG